MYLAFESFISSKYPKGRVREKDWLEDSLTQAEFTLQLKRFVPIGTSSPAKYIYDTVYKNARIEIFHSKEGESKLISTSPTDRKIIHEALSLLTKIVIQMADIWYGCHRLSGGFNLRAYQDFNRTRLAICEIVFCDNPKFTNEDKLDSESIRGGYRFPGRYNDQFLGEERPNVSGQLEVSSIVNHGLLYALFVINEDSPQVVCSVESPLDLKGFDRFEPIFFLRARNANQPKSFFSR